MPQFAALVFVSLLSADPDPAMVVARISLGEQLFHDARFSSPAGDMSASCAACHMQESPLGFRAFTEQLAKSWHPWRNEDPGRDTLRNTPTLLDVGLMPRLHYDGEFASLEEQVEKTFVGRNFGWLPGERDAALAQLRTVILEDDAYPEAITAAFEASPGEMNSETLLASIGTAVAEFMRTLRSDHDSLYDEFMDMNDLPAAPADDESPKDYGRRISARLETLERDQKLARPSGFERDAYLGLKTFFRVDGNNKAGNCVTCHVPPHFTDFAFHNTGMAQDEYDSVHGADSFLRYPIPEATEGPEKRYMSIVSRDDPDRVDLGLWNFAEGKRAETVAAFKTPTLRHLAATDPYGHNGFYPTIERAIEHKVIGAFLYRMERLRNGDPEMANIRISEDDIPQLFAFLNTLNNRGERMARPTPLGPVDTGSSSYYRSPAEEPDYQTGSE